MRSCLLSLLAIPALLAGCSPALDWREVHSTAGNYTIMMPARPVTATRSINLAGTPVDMHMTGSRVGDVTFAVGTATLPTVEAALAVLPAMREKLIQNMQGTITKEHVLAVPRGNQDGAFVVHEILAHGPATHMEHDQAHTLYLRLTAINQQVYQLLISGPADRIKEEDAAVYFSSFRLLCTGNC